MFTSDDCPDLTKISIKGKFKSLGVESIDVEKTIDLSEKIEFDVSLNDGIEFFSKVECFKDGDYYKLRFYPSEKLEQVVSIPYWMARKGATLTFTPYYKDKRISSSGCSVSYFNYLPSKVPSANTSFETWVSTSSYLWDENENPTYVGIPLGEEIELRCINQDQGQTGEYKDVLIAIQKIKIS